MSDFTVDVEQVRKQAEATRQVADSVAVAADASAHVAALDDAYGSICQAMGLPEMLRGPQQHGARMIAAITGELHDQTDGLTATAETYQQAEERIATELRKLLEMLERAARPPVVGGR